MRFDVGSNLLLKAVVGSQAFGLANENSDYDYQGVFVAPTSEFLGLEMKIQESYNFKNPDTTYHEVGKFCKLALGCNPTVLDLLWIEDYNLRTELGTELINLRNNLLSRPRVRGAYFGYANDQFGKLLADNREEKRAKNARHFLRLLEQGSELFLTGTYSIRLADPERIKSTAYKIAQGDLALAEHAIVEAEKKFAKPSALPELPNKEPIDLWLRKVRHEFYNYSNPGPIGPVGQFKVWP
jgi:predicted nucleotidyltransferase